ncbi:MATE family efflux transporter [Micromonospora aurantiaca]|uniref:MATE family efflux transporter n=1 Tax=Micromonospora aurantiaca (nom. illeg.) TaxID=47850 RepID=A0ABQ6UGA1_9ACTN|nr:MULTISPECIES: MATE family efflux transporter [Micromonospora]ADU07269.1 MATE efflux family protein [Micromonospora sp. L5]KAB1112910.1 MATE family efflux transporter [Micromonospora aurantiaca]MDG4750011.1 MATE family efflux transporter [Micromonospora sp. WMMD718]OHX03671.1 MATE family efflux transporter [Micromonospora sp. WMMB235]UFN96014.1 MATE family efflux transporter [Micromonospora aurantiaca]
MSTTATPVTASPRRIAALALPALVVLAAEPLYVLVDTAVVGHLGRVPLAALAVGGTVMTLTAWVGTVVAYGTTGRSARRFGAGDRAAAVAEGVQASWLALATGVLVAVAIGIGGGALARTLVGGPGEVADAAAGWLRIAALGAPGLLLAAAGNGWLRGIQDTRRPLLFVLGPNLLSAVLCPLLVYPAGLGLVGSAVANAIAQTLSGVLFAAALVRERVSLRPRPRVIGQQLVLSRDLLVRGVAFQASFLSATAVAARFGAAAVGAHQIAVQLWFFTALVLDALAIAAQSLVGAALGGGDAAAARFLARRIALLGGLCGVAFAVLIAAGAGVVPSWFSSDPQVREQAMTAWPWFVALQPIGGVVFALDGVLIGAGDVRYLRNLTIVCAFGGFLPAIWLAYGFDLGLGGIWAGLTLFVVLRLAGLLLRMRSGAWAVVGAVR